MKVFDITVIRRGVITIIAETDEEALKIAESMEMDDFEWCDNVEVIDYQGVKLK